MKVSKDSDHSLNPEHGHGCKNTDRADAETWCTKHTQACENWQIRADEAFPEGGLKKKGAKIQQSDGRQRGTKLRIYALFLTPCSWLSTIIVTLLTRSIPATTDCSFHICYHFLTTFEPCCPYPCPPAWVCNRLWKWLRLILAAVSQIFGLLNQPQSTTTAFCHFMTGGKGGLACVSHCFIVLVS